MVLVATYERSAGVLPLNLLSLCYPYLGWQIWTALINSFTFLSRALGQQVLPPHTLLTVKCLSKVARGPPCRSLVTLDQSNRSD